MIEELLPFQTDLVLVNLRGDTLRDALVHSFAGRGGGAWLQVSGTRIFYSGKTSRRFEKMLIRRSSAEPETWDELEPDKWYPTVTTAFLLNGGDGYDLKAETPLCASVDLKQHLQRPEMFAGGPIKAATGERLRPLDKP